MSESFTLPLLVFIRFFFPFVMIAWIMFVTGVPKTFTWTWQNMKPYALRSVFVFLGQYCIFYYLMDHTALDGTALLATAPLHIQWMRVIFDKDPLDRTGILLLCLGFIGALLMLKPDHHALLHLSALFGFLAGLANAASQRTLHSVAKSGASPLLISFFLYGFASIMALIPLLLLPKSMTYHAEMGYLLDSDLLLIFMLFSVISINNQVFRSRAYRHASHLTLLTPVTYSTIVFSALFDKFFYHISPDMFSCVGALCIAFSGIMMMRKQSSFPNAKTRENLS